MLLILFILLLLQKPLASSYIGGFVSESMVLGDMFDDGGVADLISFETEEFDMNIFVAAIHRAITEDRSVVSNAIVPTDAVEIQTASVSETLEIPNEHFVDLESRLPVASVAESQTAFNVLSLRLAEAEPSDTWITLFPSSFPIFNRPVMYLDCVFESIISFLSARVNIKMAVFLTLALGLFIIIL